MLMRLRIATFSAAALLATAVAASTPLPLLDVRMGYSPAAVKMLARIGAPSSITLTSGQSVRQLIEQRCGIVDPAYVAALVHENRIAKPSLTAEDLEQSAPGVTFAFPYCLKVAAIPRAVGTTPIAKQYDQQNVPLDANALHQALTAARAITARPLSTLRQFAGSGQAGSDRGFLATEMARLFLRENPQMKGLNLHPQDVVNVVPEERVETVPIRDDLSLEEAKALVAEIDGASSSDATLAELIDDATLLPGECQGADSADWPLPMAALHQALEDLRTKRPANLAANLPMPQILLIDTGYDPAMGPPAIPGDAFGRLAGPDPESLAVYPGINTVEPARMDANPPGDLPSRPHGGEVAAILLGARFLTVDPSELPRPKLTFASIAGTATDGRPYLNVGAIRHAFSVAVNNDVKIVNASVAAMRERDDFIRLIANTKRVLLVTAAGNVASGQQDFTPATLSWPGSLGGNQGAAVLISVGAHDPSGKLLYFSRKGKELDLLAPGCLIPTYSLDASNHVIKVSRNGTSYAAPIVSMVAAILSRETLSASQIKDRLLISGDVDERVATVSWSGSRLNVRKALSIYRDYVEYDERQSDGTMITKTLTGKLTSRKNQIILCEGQVVAQNDLRKLVRSIDPTDPSVPGVWRGWARPAGTSLNSAIGKLERCPVATTTAMGKPLELDGDDGKHVIIPLANIRDFVARMRN
ncbi:hypothetical protein D0Z70_19970 [Sphingobium terrigena]|uniref:Peptidase S8/S53 domain-containing protein n=1 Tax=Sphingobium terrigena TaxID=2304063 RepID=A0A418YMU4_9SPHN|nr:S8/S53 family peptidase [Sphingobium terrigena]RJG52487.1 hypothetical protein D0Z70_19970 [Sphingobium terrigena]